jgi:endoglucanase
MYTKRRTILFSLLGLTLSAQAQVTEAIKLNQAGFTPKSGKLAVVTGPVQKTPFYVISSNLKDTVFKGTLSEQMKSKNSSTVTRLADFSSVKKKGQYVIAVPGLGQSPAFSIGDDVYDALSKAVLKGFYYQRSNEPLLPQHAGRWSRPEGHPDTAVLVHPSAASASRPAGTVLPSPGGWYDAGDYNKYIVNSGITMGTLFSAYEDFSSYFSKHDVNIPESGDGVPDILNESIYNLRWMLTMQDPADGGVYHKCTNAAFDGMVMPGVTKLPRYVVQKSTAAALDFAAVTAQAARVLKGFEKQLPGLADSCLKASVAAWKWAEKNPNLLYNQRTINGRFDPDVSTGEYGDRDVSDEWLWAASELYATTRQSSYLTVLNNRIKQPASLHSWSNVALMGYFTMLRHSKKLPKDASTLVKNMKDTVLRMADRYLSAVPSNAFGTVMGFSKSDFVWGSNAVAANQGMVMIYAYRLTGNEKYLKAAASNLDYLMGRNATGYSFVTGFGHKQVMHPHHRPSEADGIVEPVPGLLSGGPNPGMQDKCKYDFTEPETAFSDVMCSYASNEIAINWNAPAVYLINAMNVLLR